MESHAKLGAETCQLAWSTMESLVWELVNAHGQPCRVGESGFHEKSVILHSLMECHEEFVVVSAHS